ncbi:MAG: 30S ribosome-binding factor RbfA [Proteobacteria bacterium]|nr:MAG: 30S ribosome-binding factor RbfA [Pseudomonadota bacterium]
MADNDNNRRNRQVASAIREELVAMARDDISDPRLRAVGMITFSGVDLTPDLKNATVWVSFMGKSEENGDVQKALKALRSSAKFMHRLLIKRIPMKSHPHLTFKYDNGFDRAAVVNVALNEAAALEKETAKVREELPQDEAAASPYRKSRREPEEE